MFNWPLNHKFTKIWDILSIIQDGYYEVDKAGNLVFFNQSLQEMLGYSPKEMLGMNYKSYMTRGDAEKVHKAFNQVFREREAVKGIDWQLINKSGEKLYVETSISPIVTTGEVSGFLGIIRDISKRKKAEQQARESERRLADIIDFLPDATFVVDKEGRVLIWNKAAEEMTGIKAKDMIGKDKYEYSLPFYGYKQPMPVDIMMDDSSYLQKLIPDLEIKGQTFIQEAFFPAAGSSGLHCLTATAPLFDDDDNIIAAIMSLRDINRLKQVENALQRNLDKAHNILQSTVNALAITAEKRDLFTAGHQRRVARLATAIAREMQISQDVIKSINIAATLHDIGKIQISADILSKPGKLSDLEMLLLKTHVQVGYDIIKTIPFDLPVAEMVLQHHERMDGSGYPQGLSGQEIMPEARILAVADVVEAMSSHRPYRPALGLGLAMKEIKELRGILYDPEVVDACLRLFALGQIDFS